MNKKPLDWTYLPSDVEPTSLWTCLHDAKVSTAISDRFDRTLRLEFDSDHLRKHNRLADDIGFVFYFRGVKALRSTCYMSWTGDFEVPDGVSREEHSRLIDEYHSKGRQDSVDWTTFEADLNALDSNVSDASVVQDSSNVAFYMFIEIDCEYFYDVFIRATTLNVSYSNGEPLELDQLIRVGNKYWNDFSSRSDIRCSPE